MRGTSQVATARELFRITTDLSLHYSVEISANNNPQQQLLWNNSLLQLYNIRIPGRCIYVSAVPNYNILFQLGNNFRLESVSVVDISMNTSIKTSPVHASI